MSAPENLTTEDSASDDRIYRLVEELSTLRKRGETVDIDGLAERFGVDTDVVRNGLAGLEGVGQPLEMVSETSASWVPPSLPAHFELRREIGRGGMGIVYEARQKDLDRVVAVKMLLPGQLAFGEAIHRFRKEARSLAKLKHPHIVSLHEVGETEGAVYYTMDYIEGSSLAEVIRSGEITPARAVHLLRQVTSAIAYAHSQGVVHRDLKPANILVGETGDAYVVDFGLARDTEALKGAQRTQSGLLLGTPAYMSPEQARGDSGRIGEATDIYSLGAILYQCLTGRPPVRGRSLADVIHAVIYQDPRPPRRTHPRTPRDLEVICLKALEKRPERRYATAKALGDDLLRFDRGRPIIARRPSLGYRVVRYCQRSRRQILAASALTVLVSLLLLVIIPPIVEKRTREESAGELKEARQAVSEISEDRDEAQKEADANRVEAFLSKARLALEEKRFADGAVLAAHAMEIDDSPSARGLLYAAHDLSRATTWMLLFRGKTRPLPQIACSPDGQLLATAHGEQILLRNPLDGDVVRRLDGQTGRLELLSFGSGTRLASASTDGTVSVWDANTAVELARYEWRDPSRGRRGISPTRTGFESGAKCLWRPALSLHSDGTRVALFVLGDPPRGRRVNRLLIWDSDGPASRTRSVELGVPAIDPTWKHFAVATDRDLAIFDFEGGEALRRLGFDPGEVRDLEFSRDGSVVALGLQDGSTRIWEVESGRPLRGPKREDLPIGAIALSPEGRLLATRTKEPLIKLWDLAAGAEKIGELRTENIEGELVFDAAGKHLLSSSFRHLQQMDLTSARRTCPVEARHVASLEAVLGADSVLTLSHRGEDAGPPGRGWVEDGRVVESRRQTMRTFDFASASWLTELRDLRHPVAICAAGKLAIPEELHVRDFSDDHPYQAFVRILDAATGEETARVVIGQSNRSPLRLALEPAGKFLAVQVADFQETRIRVWDLTRPRELLRLTSETSFDALQIAPGCAWLGATGGNPGTRVWALPSGTPVVLEENDIHDPDALAFSPQRSLVVASNSGNVRVWDLNTGKVVKDLTQRIDSRPVGVEGLSFSADGRWLAGASANGRLMLWETSTWQLLAELPLRRRRPTSRAAPLPYPLSFAPEGDQLAVLDGDALWLVNVPRLLEPAAGMVDRIEKETGLFLREGGSWPGIFPRVTAEERRSGR